MLDPAKLICGNCRHMGHDNSGQAQCMRYPPRASMCMIPPLVGGGEPTVIVRGFRPPVRDKEPACGEFEAKSTIAN